MSTLLWFSLMWHSLAFVCKISHLTSEVKTVGRHVIFRFSLAKCATFVLFLVHHVLEQVWSSIIMHHLLFLLQLLHLFLQTVFVNFFTCKNVRQGTGYPRDDLVLAFSFFCY